MIISADNSIIICGIISAGSARAVNTRERNKSMYYEMTIAGHKRQLPLCPINDELYIGAFIMFGDVEITVDSAKGLLAKAPEFDVIVTAESKGIPLAFEMARQAGGKDYVVTRKAPKLYMDNVITTQVNSITTDHIQTLCIGQKEADMRCIRSRFQRQLQPLHRFSSTACCCLTLPSNRRHSLSSRMLRLWQLPQKLSAPSLSGV